MLGRVSTLSGRIPPWLGGYLLVREGPTFQGRYLLLIEGLFLRGYQGVFLLARESLYFSGRVSLE